MIPWHTAAYFPAQGLLHLSSFPLAPAVAEASLTPPCLNTLPATALAHKASLCGRGPSSETEDKPRLLSRCLVSERQVLVCALAFAFFCHGSEEVHVGLRGVCNDA